MEFHNISMCVLMPALLSGCAAVPSVKDNKASGTFQGVTGDGRSIILTIEPREQGFTAGGAVDGQSAVFSATELWRSLGALMYANGSFAAAEFGLTPDGEALTIETSGQAAVRLKRGGTPVASTSGPFLGKHRASATPSLVSTATLQHHGALIVGIAHILGAPASITGRISGKNMAACVFSFADENQLNVDMELDPAKQSVKLPGIGAPVLMKSL